MTRLLTPIFITLGLACGPAFASATDTYNAQLKVLQEMTHDFPGVSVTVDWVPCGEFNSAYYPGSDHIELCTETEQRPDAAVWVAAHEFGHAITDQLLGTLSEESADEIATIWLLQHGYYEAVTGAIFWGLEEMEDNPGKPPGDPHPTWRYRVWSMLCLTDGFNDGGDAMCKAYYQGTVAKWEAQYEMNQVDPLDDLDLFILLLQE